MKHLRKSDNLYNVYTNINNYTDPTVIKVLEPEQIIYSLEDLLLDDQKFKNEEYLSLYAITEGTLTIRMNGSAVSGEYIAYSVNNEEWITIESGTTSQVSVPLNENDSVRFKGNRAKYCPSGTASTFRFSGYFIIYGNINSLTEDPLFNIPSTGPYQSSQFSYLFSGNTTLLSIKNLKIPNEVGPTSFTRMFSGCTRLKDTFEGHLKLNGNSAATYMFYNCGITHAKNLIIDVYGGQYACSNMFCNCTYLETLPVINEIGNGSYNYIYSCMFKGCTSLSNVSEDYIPGITKGSYAYNNMFSGCTKLQTIPKIKGDLSTYMCESMFAGCSGLQTIPYDYFSDVTMIGAGAFYHMFENCTNLQNGPEYLPKTPSINMSSCSYMFKNCTNLMNAPRLYSIYANDTATQMFNGCNNIEYPSISYIVYSKDAVTHISNSNIAEAVLCNIGTNISLALSNNQYPIIHTLENTTFSSDYISNCTIYNDVTITPPPVEEYVTFIADSEQLWNYCKNHQNSWLYNETDNGFGYISGLRTTASYDVYDITIGDSTLRVAYHRNENRYLWYVDHSNVYTPNDDDEGLIALWSSKSIYAFDKEDYGDCFSW